MPLDLQTNSCNPTDTDLLVCEFNEFIMGLTAIVIIVLPASCAGPLYEPQIPAYALRLIKVYRKIWQFSVSSSHRHRRTLLREPARDDGDKVDGFRRITLLGYRRDMLSRKMSIMRWCWKLCAFLAIWSRVIVSLYFTANPKRIKMWSHADAWHLCKGTRGLEGRIRFIQICGLMNPDRRSPFPCSSDYHDVLFPWSW